MMKYQNVLGVALLVVSSSVLAGNVQSGRDLHNENCISCHKDMVGGDGSGIYTREDRKMDSYEALQNQVMRCKTALDAPWPKHQVDDVVTYLNTTFYKFDTK